MADDGNANIDLDLDALAPQPVQISYQGGVIKVNPLDLVQFSQLFALAAEMGKITETTDSDQVTAVYTKMESFVKQAIPELAEEKLNTLQLTAIFNLLSQLNTPQDKALAELQKRGIKLTKEEQADRPKASTS